MDNPRYIHTLYCDDIRQETNGKAIYVGVYGNAMNITVDEAALKENNGNPLQYAWRENPMDRGAWQATYSSWDRKESDMTQHAHSTLFTN